MSNSEPVVPIDGTDYPLSAFPAAQREMFDYDMLGASDGDYAEELADAGFPPAECVTAAHREWQKSKAIVDGRIARAYVLGIVYTAIVGFAPARDFQVLSEHDDRDYERDEVFERRMEWLSGKGGYVIWVRRHDTGDGIMLPQTVYSVAFTSQHLEAAFVAKFPEVAQ
ncbi:hypothetical protein E5554_16130 [Sphingobium sp. PAMC28499]|uniref:hypothetical protein n=1 Tax=Sphingobium sp. PAMC28499 TaxID=2565554 RepID=UPI00109DA856|nr:hypothetical protein [Sphingobium sp. PAMC28499]QCB39222.1 hypothetical protein E5554_16130 [Sphingobium sp. PAMC28499]